MGFTKPDTIKLQMSETGFNLSVAWNTQNPGFADHQAVEFEVWLLTKCWVQPLGGRDDNPRRGLSKIPGWYTDVWNFWWPESASYWNPFDSSGGLNQIAQFCGTPFGWSEIFTALTWKDRSDILANFAVGTRTASELNKYPVGYEFSSWYPLERSAACATGRSFDAAAVRMHVFPNECTLKKFGVPYSPEPLTCPHFIGFDDCQEIKLNPGSVALRSLVQGVCVPTDYVEIVVDSEPDYGFFDPNANEQPSVSDLCVDGDGDAYFQAQDPEVLGTRVGDCDDSNSSIGNDAFDHLANACVAATPSANPGCPASGTSCMASGTSAPTPQPPPETVQETLCPFGSGLYCGDGVDGRDPGRLYYCDNGTYAEQDRCGGRGCQGNGAGVDDECVSEPCGDAVCDNSGGESCAACAVDCCPAAPRHLQPAEGTEFQVGASIFLTWAPVAGGSRYRVKVCTSRDLQGCLTCPGSTLGTCEFDEGELQAEINGLLNLVPGTYFWQAQAITEYDDANRTGWGPLSTAWSFTILDPAAACIDGCLSGYQDCPTATSRRYCGTSFDDDPCWEIGSPQNCAPGLACIAGDCVESGTVCADQCPLEGIRCVDSTRRDCALGNSGCLELGPAQLCPTGYSCVDGQGCVAEGVEPSSGCPPELPVDADCELVINFNEVTGWFSQVGAVLPSTPRESTLSFGASFSTVQARLSGGHLEIQKTLSGAVPAGNYGASVFWSTLGIAPKYARLLCPLGEVIECVGTGQIPCTGSWQIVQSESSDSNWSCGLGKATATTLMDWVAVVSNSGSSGMGGAGNGGSDGNPAGGVGGTAASGGNGGQVSLPTCGNGFVEQGEECDDGNDSNQDSCLDGCFFASCGDGFTEAVFEDCDDGNVVANDGCDENCVNEEMPPDPICGNNILEEGELCDPCPGTCDDGNACTTNTLSGPPCSVQCSSTPVTACTTDGCCPEGCSANNDADCPPSCGNGTQEGQENCASCPADAPCAMSGFTCFAGQCEACGSNGQPCCSGGTACFDGECEVSNGICQPLGPTLHWSETFESFSWDHVGQGTLPDGIAVWDADGIIRTLTGGGASGGGLTWWGGSSSGVPSSATMTLPPVIQAGRTAELRFKAYYAFLGNIQIIVGRSTCPSTALTVPNGSWNSITVPLADCGSSGKVVFQLGNLYNVATGGQALKFDDIEIYYLN